MLRGVHRVGLLLLVSVLPAVAHAQSGACANASSADIDEAIALFDAGSAAVDAGRWSDAIAGFERAYRLSCSPGALFNLAVSLRALGRHREARDAFDRLLSAHPDLAPEMREQSETYRQEMASRVAVLELLGIDESARPSISFDGREVPDDGQRPTRIETDAGNHSVVARIPDHQPFVWEGSLRDGQRESIQVTFEALVEAGGFDPVPLIIAIVAAGIVAGGVAVGYVLWDDMQLRPLNPDRMVTVGGP